MNHRLWSSYPLRRATSHKWCALCKRGIDYGDSYHHAAKGDVHQECAGSATIALKTNGTSTDWSWTECLSPTPHDKKVRRAFRVLLEPQVIKMKQRFFDTAGGVAQCPITGAQMTFTSAHVDHIPPQTFETLFNTFIQEEGIDLAAVQISSEGKDNIYQDTIADESLAARWLDYHERSAALRVISARANLSEVKRGADMRVRG